MICSRNLVSFSLRKIGFFLVVSWFRSNLLPLALLRPCPFTQIGPTFRWKGFTFFLIRNRILMEIFFSYLLGRFMFPCVPHKLVISVLAGVSSDSASWTLPFPSAIESPGLSLYVGSSGMEFIHGYYCLLMCQNHLYLV